MTVAKAIILAFEKGFRAPVNQTKRTWTHLQRNPVANKRLVFHDANRWIKRGIRTLHFWSEVHEWFGRYLQATET